MWFEKFQSYLCSLVMGPYRGTTSRCFPTKAEEQFICLWNGDNTQPGIKLVFQEIFEVIKTQILCNPLIIKIQILSRGRL